TNVSFDWAAADSSGTYTLEYGPLGFILGTGVATPTSETELTVNGLSENTYYDAYLRYDCSNGDKAKTLGPITFKTLFLVDVGISGLAFPTVDDCVDGLETIEVFIQNYGQSPQSLIPFFYAVNGVVAPVSPPVDGLYTGVVSNDSMEVIGFDAMYDFTQPGTYLIQAWTAFDPDSNVQNDTFSIELVTGYPLPIQEDFEDGVLPELWTSDEFNPIYAPGAHNNPTWVYGANLYSFNNMTTFKGSRQGVLAAGDSLTFDYRYTDWPAGLDPITLNGDSLVVELSVDCGETFIPIYVITEDNHVPTADFTNIGVDLSFFAGQSIILQFRGVWGSQDYWLDLDNINVSGCPVSFLSDVDIVPASNADTTDASITLTPTAGTAPFSFQWSTSINDTQATLANIGPGIYTVTITDANDCMEVVQYQVGIDPTNVEELISFDQLKLVPNPTTGQVQLELELSNTANVDIQIFDAVGRLLEQRSLQNVRSARPEFDLDAEAPGMYFVRVATGTQVRIGKLIIAR
ncbi:MAG: T9SS type A sorting domain-containing protein, partial [Phaeodactylibacter sp.]|nr:T9SS type A sorting domain-containing protein [Phaeodactylibacter sp.]